MKGDKEERNGGTAYVRWGNDQCPSTAQLVYSGRAGGAHFQHPGSGSNPQCLPLDPNFLTPISGNQHWRGIMYGAEYETVTDSNSHVHGRDNADVPCAVCHVSSGVAKPGPTRALARASAYLALASKTDKNHVIVC